MSFFTHRSSLQAPPLTLARLAAQTERRLTQEYRANQALFTAQPVQIQFFIKDQAHRIGAALIHGNRPAGFSMPHWVMCEVGANQPLQLPASYSWQKLGSWKDRVNQTPLLHILDRRLSELERENHPAVAAGAVLLRYAIALHLVRDLLPPVSPIASNGGDPERAKETSDQELSDLVTVLVAGCPQPVQPFVEIFRAAVSLAAYIAVDDDYRRKHYNLLGGYLEQCRSLATYETGALIQNLRERAEASGLNRGLSLSLPYFDDQQLETRVHDFSVIPAGRISFDPALLVAAAREEQVKVAEDLTLSASTRLNLIGELRMIEKAFQDRPHSINTKGSA